MTSKAGHYGYGSEFYVYTWLDCCPLVYLVFHCIIWKYFLFHAILHWLEIYSTILHRSSEIGHHCLIHPGEALMHLLFSIVAVVGFCGCIWSTWGSFLLFVVCFQFLSGIDVGFSQMHFLHLLWCSHEFSFTPLSYLLLFGGRCSEFYWLTDIQILNLPYITWVNPTWSWGIIFFVHYWISLAENLLGFLHLCSWEILICSFLSL